MFRKFIGGAVVAVALGAASIPQASATIVDVTYTGEIYNSYDELGVFGPSGQNLNELELIASFTFDTALPGLPGFNEMSPTYSVALGGSGYFSTTSPALSAAVTINGVSVSLGTDFFSSISLSKSPGFNQQAHSVSGSDDSYMTGSIHNFSMLSTLPATIDEAFTYSVIAGDHSSGDYSYFYARVSGAYAYARLYTLTYEVAQTPLPAAIPLFGSALGLFGFFNWLRRRFGSAETVPV